MPTVDVSPGKDAISCSRKTRRSDEVHSPRAGGRAATGGKNAERSVTKAGAKIRRKQRPLDVVDQDAELRATATHLFGAGDALSDAFVDVFGHPFSVEPAAATTASALLPTTPSTLPASTNAGAQIVAKAIAQSGMKSARVNHASDLCEFGCIVITELHIMLTLVDEIRRGTPRTYTLLPPLGSQGEVVRATRWNKLLINIVDINIKLKTITYVTLPVNGSKHLTLSLEDFNRIEEYREARVFKRRGKRSAPRHPRSIDTDLHGIPNTLGAIPRGRHLARDKCSITPRDGVGAAWCADPPTAFVAVGQESSVKEAKQHSNVAARAAPKAARAATLMQRWRQRSPLLFRD